MRLAFLALAFSATAASADVSTAVKAPDAPPLSVWRPVEGGAYEHLQTGLLCPAKLDGYRRADAAVFDAFGLDVGCNLTSGTAGLTFYLTRREGNAGLDAAMAEANRELLDAGAARHARLLSQTTTREGDLDWTVALYGEDGGTHSAIWISDLWGWTYEYRATYPAEDEARVVSEIKAHAATVRASAGARLELCARTPQPERPGRAVTDETQIQSAAMMSSILGGAEMAAAQEHKGKPDEPLVAPIVWCVDRAVTQAGYSMLFWRGVHADGTGALSDRVTLVTLDRPPLTLTVSAGGLAGLIEAANKKDGEPEQWAATLEHGDQTLIFGYFAGRPSADLVTELFGRILSGKQKAVGGYSAKGKNITIVAPSK